MPDQAKKVQELANRADTAAVVIVTYHSSHRMLASADEFRRKSKVTGEERETHNQVFQATSYPCASRGGTLVFNEDEEESAVLSVTDSRFSHCLTSAALLCFIASKTAKLFSP